MGRTVRLAAVGLATLLAGSVSGLPADAALGAVDRETVTRNCSGAADAVLRVWRENGHRYVRLRVVNAAPGSPWSVRWSYSTGESGTGAEVTATASDAGAWARLFSTGDTSRHFTTTVRGRSAAGQVCRVTYEQ